jgi:hypothetical protein
MFYDANIRIFQNIESCTILKQGNMGIECEFDIDKYIKNETRKDYK